MACTRHILLNCDEDKCDAIGLQDDLLDLFGKKGSPLSIKRDVLGAVQVEGAHQRTANTARELLSIFQEGMRRRSTAATQMNFEVRLLQQHLPLRHAHILNAMMGWQGHWPLGGLGKVFLGKC